VEDDGLDPEYVDEGEDELELLENPLGPVCAEDDVLDSGEYELEDGAELAVELLAVAVTVTVALAVVVSVVV
jgi:hypothetical protein